MKKTMGFKVIVDINYDDKSLLPEAIKMIREELKVNILHFGGNQETSFDIKTRKPTLIKPQLKEKL